MKSIFDFCCSVLMWTLLTPACLLYICLLAFRTTIHLLAWILRPDLIPIYNPIEHLEIGEPSKAHPTMNLSASFIMQGHLDVKEFRDHFDNTFLSTEQLRQRYTNLYCYFVQWGGYMFKKPVAKINLKERIREVHLEVKNQNQLEEYIANYIELNDYGENPNWEILLIHFKDINIHFNQMQEDVTDLKEGRSIFVFKIDHALCDGYSMIHLTDTLCGIKSPYPVQKQETSLLNTIRLFWNAPLTLSRLVLSLVRSGEVPWLNLDNGNKEMYMSWGAIDMEKFKQARLLAGCHFATLMGVVMTEASRRFFVEKRPGSILPKHVWQFSPWGQPDHPVMFGGPITNHFTFMGFQIKMDDSDLVAKINEAEKHYRKVSEEWNIPELLFRVTIPMFWPIPTSMLRRLRNVLPEERMSSRFGHVIAPNLRPMKGCPFLGVELEEVFPHVRFSSALNHTRLQMFTINCRGKVNFSIGGRKDTFHGKEEIDYIAKALVPQVFEDTLAALELKEK